MKGDMFNFRVDALPVEFAFVSGLHLPRTYNIPIGPIVVPFWGSYLEFYKVIPKRNYYGAYVVYRA